MHLHCLVPGGAVTETRQWHPARSTHLFPVRALVRHVRGGFVSRLRKLAEDGGLSRIENGAEIDTVLDGLMSTNSVPGPLRPRVDTPPVSTASHARHTIPHIQEGIGGPEPLRQERHSSTDIYSVCAPRRGLPTDRASAHAE